MLECLGMPLPLHEKQAVDCLTATNFTFLFAPAYHPAMKAVMPIRGAMLVRTVFNVLGPLTNPAAPPYQLIGAYSKKAARLMAETLAGMQKARTEDLPAPQFPRYFDVGINYRVAESLGFNIAGEAELKSALSESGGLTQ